MLYVCYLIDTIISILKHEFEISFFVTFSAKIVLRPRCYELVVTGGGNRSTLWKPPPNPKSLAYFLHATDGIRTRTVVKDRCPIYTRYIDIFNNIHAKVKAMSKHLPRSSSMYCLCQKPQTFNNLYQNSVRKTFTTSILIFLLHMLH